MNAAKLYGRVYTPLYLVRIMLDYCDYTAHDNILQKHIIDNSCGDGAFLVEVTRRYCQAFENSNADKAFLKNDLETFIHGIEINAIECEKCKQNLDFVAETFGVTGVNWDVICADALTISQYNGKMDFVVGNPPYVRVHNLSNNTYNAVKNFSFAQDGMVDLFVVFFEIGFNMMSSTGKMCLITPNSWLTSVAGTALRDHLAQTKQLDGVIDLGHFQAFKATTYSLISRFSRRENDVVEYNSFNEKKLNREFRGYIKFSDMNISGAFYLADANTLHKLRKIRSSQYEQKTRVKNGFATLADSVFIGDWKFSGLTIDVVKSSTGKWQKCIFPYKDSKPISLADIAKDFPDVYAYYTSHKKALCKDLKSTDITSQQNLFGTTDTSVKEERWHLFGRTQAINDVSKEKIAINTVIKNSESIKLSIVPKGAGVYGGLYILTTEKFEKIKEIVTSEEYISYISALKNYKSGGYYTCSAKDIELYLNYKLSNNE